MENEHSSKISLLDLSTQFQFEIDDAIKKELCFGETLIISCGHYEGEIRSEVSESDWSCSSSTVSEASEEIKDEKIYDAEEKLEEESVAEKDDEEDNDFHFFFFPDCTKPPPPVDSKASIVLVDGMPKINPTDKKQIVCTCDHDKNDHCECFVKLPCKCGAKTKAECSCSKLESICICVEGQPKVTCTCGDSKVCTCFPNKLLPICPCVDIEKPCICGEKSGKFPSAICTCKYKPKFVEELKSIGEEGEQVAEEQQGEEEEPCTCQETKPEPECECLTGGKDCTCRICCICSMKKSCFCEPIEGEEVVCKSEENKSACKSDESKSVCKCVVRHSKECVCEEDGQVCTCFPKPLGCTCGDPDNCKCFTICECTDPCICDTAPVEIPECICLDKKKNVADVCTCQGKDDDRAKRKLRRKRAGKHGYRWCHEVDSHHTFFDYGYGRRDKIVEQEELLLQKVNILGLHDEIKKEEVCPVHAMKAPPYEKKIRKPSIDCCSSVGGISICVETLGEDKDKFLVQVVSNSSKEGAKCATKLVSILDCMLHTMEENRTEHITKKNVAKERKSYMAICSSGYYNKISRICGERSVVKRFYYSFEKAKNFLLEGANVVLMRYLAVRRYRGNVKTDTVMINGLICESICAWLYSVKYQDTRNNEVCDGVSEAMVNGKPLFVEKVERHIIEPSGIIHQTLTVLTLRGYIVSHEWADSCYMFHINPLLNIVPERDEIEPHAPLRARWREDLQLLSDYLDFKSSRSSEGSRYVTESGGLTGTVRDYLQAILLLRPHDALHFTRHYFSSALSALDLPHDEYFDPSSKHVRYYFFEE